MVNQVRSAILRRAVLLAVCAGVSPAALFSAAILVPNGDFSDTANNGNRSGTLIAPSYNGSIGSGPWSGSGSGLFNFLAPPTLNIGSGVATISGIAGVGAVSITDNSGSFYQSSIGTNYQANATYTLAANVSTGTALMLATLANSGVGIALLDNGTVAASTLTSPNNLVTLRPLTGNTYSLELTFTAATGGTGHPIGIRLFDTPSNLANANLIPAVTFDNVTLDALLLAVPEPATMWSFALFLALTLGLIHLRRKRLASRVS